MDCDYTSLMVCGELFLSSTLQVNNMNNFMILYRYDYCNFLLYISCVSTITKTKNAI